MPVRRLLLLGVLCSVGLMPQLARATVTLNPGDNVQSIVNANPVGTTYFFNAGTYRMQSITAKTGDTYTGAVDAGNHPLVTLNGSKVITAFSGSGPYTDSADMPSGLSQDSQSGHCNTSVAPRCFYVNDLFRDSVRLKHVTSTGALVAGTWYYDTSAHVIYVFDNPSGHTMEIGITTYAFPAAHSITNVMIKNFIIEKYADPSQHGAIDNDGGSPGSQSGWTVQNVEARNNHGGGIRIDSGRTLQCFVHHNFQLGVSGTGSNSVVDGNEISYNGQGYDSGWEAGGSKWFTTSHLEVRNNYAHDNYGPGLWTDYDNTFAVFEGNRSEGNTTAGIMSELSFDLTVRYNFLRNNDPDHNGAGAEINIVDTSRSNVYGNTINTGNWNGIALVRDCRTGTGGSGETFGETGENDHDNTVVWASSHSWANQLHAGGTCFPGIYTDSTNQITHNTYKLDQPTSTFFGWNGTYNWSGWQAAGHDTTGTLISWSNTGFPSTAFSPGAVTHTTNSSTQVRSLPSTVDGTLITTLGANINGTVTVIAGPIYSGGLAWWRVAYPSVTGWTVETSLASGSSGSPTITSLSASPTVINPGQSSTISWSVAGATSLTLNGVSVIGTTSKVVTPAATTTYQLIATNSGGQTQSSVTVTVSGVTVPTISSFTASPSSIVAGASSTLAWSTVNATSLTLNGVNVTGTTSKVVTPSVTTTYQLVATNAGGSATASLTVVVSAGPVPPTILSFTAIPSTINIGALSTLSWSVSNYTSLSISGIGTVTGSSKVVTPSVTTTYILTATNSNGSTTSSVTITVNPVNYGRMGHRHVDVF